jgi:hypothetical protein
MKHGIFVVAAAAMTILSGTAFAQSNGKPRFDVGEQGITAFGATLPNTPPARLEL